MCIRDSFGAAGIENAIARQVVCAATVIVENARADFNGKNAADTERQLAIDRMRAPALVDLSLIHISMFLRVSPRTG